MKLRTVLVLATFTLSGCGSSQPTTHAFYGQLNNDRVYGTVVSVNEGETPAVHTADPNTSVLSPVTGMFSSIGNSISHTVDTTATLHYVIRKDNGQLVNVDQVPEAGESILYPGQHVMVQANGNYFRVYPSNVEDPLSQQVPGSVRQ